MRQPTMGKVLTMPEVAKIAGWERQRMRRHLLRMHRESGGTLLRNIGTSKRPRWTVTLDAMKRTAPEWFVEENVGERIDALEREIAHLRRLLAATNQTLVALLEPTKDVA